ncbi:MAG: MFS transporter [Gammaproteobacteria bacterium]|nr:MFS transporter [Gammaproteobacteria bacterium]
MAQHIFRSLRHRNFRLFYLGQLVSLNGTWMQSTAQAWLVYRLTGSGTLLGLVASATLVPHLIFAVYGGWLADRFSRRRLMIIAQILAMVQAIGLGVLTVAGWVQAWHILLLALMLGLVQAIETPVRQSFISQLVPREDLPNAIALNSSMFHLARFIGPALAGVLVAWVGEGPVFLLNAVTFIAVLVSLTYLRLPTIQREHSKTGVSGLWSGLHFAREHNLIRTLLLLVASVSLLGSAMVVLLPIFVVQVFEQGPRTLGLLMAMLGAGSLSAALLLAGRRDFRLLERRVAIAAISMATGLVLFAANPWHTLALPILFVLGFAGTTVFASSNTLIQLAVPDELRGRVMALFTISLQGMVSIGQLILGAAADHISVTMVIAGCGISLFILGGILARFLYRLPLAPTTA